MFVVLFVFLSVFSFTSLYDSFTMPESVANLKRENNSLKAQVSTMADEISRLKEMIEQKIGNTVSPTSNDGVRSVEFLSKEYDDLNCFRTMAKKELQRLSTSLAELKTKVDAIANVIDEFQDHSFLYNIKMVGVPEISVDESAASTSKLCLNIFKEMGANVTVNDIDTVHRVPSRNSNGKPKPIVCRFVRRLAKDMVMSVRKDICRVNPAAAGLPEDSSLSTARIFDHLSPRMQTVLFEAKKFKEQHRYQYCWSKGSFVYLRKNTSSRAIRIKDLDDLGRLQTEGNS